MSENTPDTPAPKPMPVPQTVPTPDVRPRPRRGVLWFGVLLVGFGIVLLVEQLVPSVGLWRWWPLVVVLIGVRQMFGPSRGGWTPRNLGDGLFTVAIGLVLLGQMLGLLGWNVWLNILRLWPLLLVSFGLEIIGKAIHSEWVRALGSLVVVGGLAYGALVMTPTAGWPPTVVSAAAEPFEFREPHRARVDEGVADVAGGAGELSVGAGDDLAAARGSSAREPVFDVEVDRRTATVEASVGEGVRMPVTSGDRLDVALDRDVVWDLTVQAGVSSFSLDLEDLSLSALSVESGVSSGRITLGEPGAAGGRGAVVADIEAGVSEMRVRIPRGESARVTVSEGLSGVESRGTWDTRRTGGDRVYESSGFSADGPYWDVRIQSGVGGITIEYY